MQSFNALASRDGLSIMVVHEEILSKQNFVIKNYCENALRYIKLAIMLH